MAERKVPKSRARRLAGQLRGVLQDAGFKAEKVTGVSCSRLVELPASRAAETGVEFKVTDEDGRRFTLAVHEEV